MIRQRFGKLVVLQKVNKVSKYGRPYYRCQCDCGQRLTVAKERLVHRTKPKTHCGCENAGLPTQYKIEYHAWWDMTQRCHNVEHPGYKRYGAKGIKVCSQWQSSFETFLEDVGPRPNSLSLDRIDPFGNYEPTNVRWADAKTQARNKKETKVVAHPITGKPIKAAELAEELGVSYQKMRADLMEAGKW